MYELFTLGIHPLYKSDETNEEFIEKVLRPNWKFTKNFPV